MKINKKGFTLVELLAVIVILALLIVITANTILPMMNKTKKNAMVVYASKVLEQASANYVIDSMSNGGESIVYSIENMMGGNTKYYGAVKASTTDDGKYSYDIAMFDDEEEIGLFDKNLTSSEITNNVDDIVSTENYEERKERTYYKDATKLEDHKFTLSSKINLLRTSQVKDVDCTINASNGKASYTGSSNWRCTEYFIKISPEENYKFNGAAYNNDRVGVAFYKEADESSSSFISGLTVTDLIESNGVFKSPTDANYMRATWVKWGTNTNWETDLYIIKNS